MTILEEILVSETKKTEKKFPSMFSRGFIIHSFLVQNNISLSKWTKVFLLEDISVTSELGVIINKAAIYICDQVWTFPTHPNKYKEDPLLDCSVVQPGLVCDELG